MEGEKRNDPAKAGPSAMSVADKADDTANTGCRQGKLALEALVYDCEGVRTVPVQGRTAWALQQLMQAGPEGCTPITHPGPRWSAYVFNLRQTGINVETIYEGHSGPFAGHHARYVLRSVVALRQPAGVA